MNKMKNFFIILLFLSCVVNIMNCSDKSVTPDITTATFSILLYDEFPKTSHGNLLTMTDPGGTTFTIEEALVNVGHIHFELPDGETDTLNQVRFNGPFVMDIEDVESNPEIAEFDMTAGIYRQVEVRFDDAKAEDGLVDASNALIDNTMLVKGTFDYTGKTGRNFTFIFKFNEDVIFEKPSGFTVKDGKKNNVIIALLVDRWLSDINITDCLDSGSILLDDNGDLLIDEDNGNGVCNNFKEDLKEAILNTYDINSIL
jgi:hypothetical protein